METKLEASPNGESPHRNWSEEVEDLVAAGDTDGAISLLETVVSKLQNSVPVDLRLASALSELANLYSSKGFSLKSDELLSQASLIKLRTQSLPSSDKEHLKWDSESNASSSPSVSVPGNLEESSLQLAVASPCNGSSDDDWEAIADLEPEELLSSQCLPSISKVSLEDTKGQTPKRRGRGTFSYKKHTLYSEVQSDSSLTDVVEDEDLPECKQNTESKHSKYGTRHVLVLADFPPTTRTMELEMLVEDFNGRGVAIRWVNDTVALAVFRSPSVALEAHNSIKCPFTVRFLDEDDILLSSIKIKDLEPPRQRPQTSARAAKRLIAQGMGLKMPSTFGSRELKTQEEARKNRIDTRHKLRHDAWGDD